MAKSALDVIGPAFDHTRKQLGNPFRIGQWVRLAALGLATGELSSQGGCGWSRLGRLSQPPYHSQSFVSPQDMLRGIDPALIGILLVIAVVGGLLFMLVWIYVASISRFILFDAILRKTCDSLNEGWRRWHSTGMGFFWWQLGLSLVSLVVAALLFVPLLIPLLVSLKNHREMGPGMIVAFLPMITVFLIFALCMALIVVLAKDFVVPLMALDGVGVMEGWRRLLAMMRLEKASYAGYIVMKVVLSIGASVVFGIISGITAFFAAIPFVIAGVVIWILVKGAGVGWNVFTITALIVGVMIAVAVLLCVIAFVSVPVAVFFPAYAMYFFADRYPALQARLYPAPPQIPPAAAPTWTLPPEPVG